MQIPSSAEKRRLTEDHEVMKHWSPDREAEEIVQEAESLLNTKSAKRIQLTNLRPETKMGLT